MKAVVSLMFVVVSASPLSAQDTTQAVGDSAVVPTTTPYRSPHRALILGSIIPGAGHIYSGEYWHGFLNYETTVGMIGGGVMVFYFDKCAFNLFSPTPCKSGPRWPYQVVGVASVGMGIWQWISSARDAPHAAERANAKHRRKTSAPAPIIEPPVDSHSGWRVGAQIHL
jgi:hypothetical protein